MKLKCDVCNTVYDISLKQCPRCSDAGELSTAPGIWQPGQMFAHYRLEEELGRGGMGVVYKAHDTRLDRVVALKMIAGESYSNYVARFIRESKVAASLDHACIVRVYDAGTTPANYYTMEFIEGESLAKFLLQRPPLTKKLQILEKVARALHEAHKRNIIHRDIKPGNIMIDRYGQPRLLDFGLAKFLEASASNIGEIAGTMAYMSPEQITGKKVGRAGDIYSLGVTLYEMFTDVRPFHGNFATLSQKIAEEAPVPPSKLNPDIPAELEAICSKCLEKEPQKRYISALLLAEDIRRFLTHRPVLAARPTTLSYLKRWGQRHYTLVFTSAVFLLLLLLSCGGLLWLLYREKMEAMAARDEALQQKENAIRQREEAIHQRNQSEQTKLQMQELQAKMQEANYRLRVSLAHLNFERNDIATVDRLLSGELYADRRDNIEWRLLYRLIHHELSSWQGHQNAVIYGVFSDDSKRFFSGDQSGSIVSWDINTGRATEIHNDYSSGFFHFRGTQILLATPLKIFLLDIERQITKDLFRVPESAGYQIMSMALSSDKTIIAAGTNARTVLLHNLTKSGKWYELVYKTPVATNNAWSHIYCCAFSSDGKLLATASGDMKIRLWDVAGRRLQKEFVGHQHKVSTCAFSSDGKLLVSGSRDHTARLWDVASGKLLQKLDHGSEVFSCLFTDVETVVSAGEDKNIKVWSVATGELQNTLRGHYRPVRHLNLADETLISAGNDGMLKRWDLGYSNPLVLRGHKGEVRWCDFSPDGNTLASVSNDFSVRLWDVKSGTLKKILAGHWANPTVCAFNADGKILTSGGADKQVHLWNLANGKAKKIDFPKYIISCDFAPHGNLLAVASPRNLFALYDNEQRVWSSEKESFYCCRFSPSGNTLALGCVGKSLLVDSKTGKVIRVFAQKKQQTPVHSCAFDDDGQTLLTASNDGQIDWWQIATGHHKRSFIGHDGPVTSVAFTSSQKGELRIISSGYDGTLRIWDPGSGECLVSLQAHSSVVHACVISPDSTKIATASDDRTIKIWDISPIGAK